MVLEILADARQVVRDRDAVLLQERARADARELEDLRRADRAGGEDRLDARGGELGFAPAHELDAGGAPAVEAHPLDERIGHDGEVRPVHGRLEEALRRAPPHAAALVHLEEPGAVVVAAVEVVGPRNAGLDHCLPERVQDLPGEALPLDAPLAARTVEGVGAAV